MGAGASKAAKQQVASILAKARDDEFRRSTKFSRGSAPTLRVIVSLNVW